METEKDQVESPPRLSLGMKFKAQDIDWEDLENYLGTHEGDDPEAIIHELCHVVDAVGIERAFKGDIGDQRSVDDLIHESFSSESELKDSEIRTTALTILTLKRLGIDSFESSFRSMVSNVLGKEVKLREQINLFVVSPSVKDEVDAIFDFLKDFLAEPEEEA